MDRRERWDDLTEIHHTGVERHLDRVWTAMPVAITEDTPDGHIVKLQPTIKGQQRDPKDGTIKHVEMPIITEVPIQYSSGGGFTITHPIKKGDEGLAVFASRCIDGWWDKGGLQPSLDARKHNLSDAIYIPGIRSKPRKLGGDDSQAGGGQSGGQLTIDLRGTGGQQPKTAKVSLDTLQIRTDKGDVYIELTSDSVNITVTQKVTVKCKELDITATDKVHIDTPLIETTGEIRAAQDITAGASVSSSSVIGFGPAPDPLSGKTVSLQNHTHGQVQGGTSHTGPPD